MKTSSRQPIPSPPVRRFCALTAVARRSFDWYVWRTRHPKPNRITGCSSMSCPSPDSRSKPASRSACAIRSLCSWFRRQPPKPDLHFTLKRIDGKWQLEAENRGGTRAQIGATRLVDAAGKSHPVTDGLLGYALAGQRRLFSVTWPVDKAPATPLAIDAAINTVPTRFVVQIDGGP